MYSKTYRIQKQAVYTGIQDPYINMEGSLPRRLDKWIWHPRVLFDKLALLLSQNPLDEPLRQVTLDQQNQPRNN